MPNISDEQLAEYRRIIAELQAEFERLKNAPHTYATVIHMDKGRIVLSSGGSLQNVEAPAKLKLAAGDTVLLDMQSGQIIDTDTLPATGDITRVQLVRTDEFADVSVGGSTRTVLAGKLKGQLKEEDEVILDASKTIILAKLHKPKKERFAVVKGTGVCWNDIGGQETAKQAMREAIELPLLNSKIYQAYGRRDTKGILLSGPPGCIDGEAAVTINRGGKGFTLKLKDLVHRFNSGTFKGTKGKQKNRSYTWDPAIPTMVRCYHNGEFRLRLMTAAYPKGVKAVMKLVLSDGKSVRLTPDHEVLTRDNGWLPAERLVPGDIVLTNGVSAPTKRVGNSRWLDAKGYWWITVSKNHPFFASRMQGSYDMPEHRMIAEARENGFALQAWLDLIRSGMIDGCRFLTSNQHVHHKDGDSTNNHPDNLVVLTQSEHAKEHEMHRHIPVFLAKEVEVVSCEADGETEVFDITVEDAHNFTANGIVVHNCGKTLLGKAAATAITELTGATSAFMYVKGPEVLDPYVGVAEATVREIFRKAREHKEAHGAPAVVFIDEADAILGRRGSFYAHMEKTIVPMFLTEMDGLEASGALVILATNRPDTLDPAIVRDGRMDRKVRVERPTEDDAKDIFKLYLSKVPVRHDTSVSELATLGAFGMFDTTRTIRTTYQNRQVNMPLQALASGSLIAGAVDKAVSFALRRDLDGKRKSPSGVNKDDLFAALDQAAHESRDVDHTDAILELAERLDHGHAEAAE